MKELTKFSSVGYEMVVLFCWMRAHIGYAFRNGKPGKVVGSSN